MMSLKASFMWCLQGCHKGRFGLSTLLVLIYSKDLPEVISNSKVVLYADGAHYLL